MVSRRAVLAAGFGGSLALSAPGIGIARAGDPAPSPTTPILPTPIPPTIDELLQKAVLRDASLSPDGKRLAILREQREGGKRLAYLLLANAETMSGTPERVVLGDYEVEQVLWANEERLLLWLSFDTDPVIGTHAGQLPPSVYWVSKPVRRIMSVDLKGGSGVLLFANDKRAIGQEFDLGSIVDMVPSDPRTVIMQAWGPMEGVQALYKVDVYTGEATLFERGLRATLGWISQDGISLVRYDRNAFDTRLRVMMRDDASGKWQFYRDIRLNEVRKSPDFNIVCATPEPGILLVTSRPEGSDTDCLRRFNIRTREYGDVVARVNGRDVDAAAVDPLHGLIGASYYDDRLNYVFADPTLAAHYKGVNGYFGNACNVAIQEADVRHNRMILGVSGPRDAGSLHLYDRAARQLKPIGECYPWLTPERLAPMEVLKVRTRDDAEITAYLTTPIIAATGARPMVVMPHGGPEARDHLGYDFLVQSLAARGWVVLQPNFRGSAGYGNGFREAGHRRWGDRMQQDVEDAVAMVVAAGRADPKHLAICGGSYGGYAALMGGILRPDLYRAIVSMAGPSDLMKMLDYERIDGSDSESYAYWRSVIGDPHTEAERIRAACPALRAAEIAAPVQLIHGAWDGVVPVEQSKMMQKALKAADRSCVYLELPRQGHFGFKPDIWKTVLTTTCDFLAAHI
ncbi:MAG: family peptidase [Caulobacter sp.]|nr:family peptidase [Caulobacter sp.]